MIEGSRETSAGFAKAFRHAVTEASQRLGKLKKELARDSDMRPDRFSWSADRSTDEGRTWTTSFQTIEARRIGPARTLGPLAPAKR